MALPPTTAPKMFLDVQFRGKPDFSRLPAGPPAVRTQEGLRMLREVATRDQAPAWKVLDGLRARNVIDGYMTIYLTNEIKVSGPERNFASVQDALKGIDSISRMTVRPATVATPE